MNKNSAGLAIESEHPDGDHWAARELAAREPIFHYPELGVVREDFDRMMADEYWEVGASRRTYLVTYLLEQTGNRLSRRCTTLYHLGRLGPGGWRTLYHQGTLTGVPA